MHYDYYFDLIYKRYNLGLISKDRFIELSRKIDEWESIEVGYDLRKHKEDGGG